MTWLKRIGQIAVKGLELAVGVAPQFSQAFPQALPPGRVQPVVDTLGKLEAVIVNAEAFGSALGLAGTDKLKAASGPITQILLSDFLAGRKIADKQKFATAAAGIASNLADLLNSLDGDDVDTTKP